MCVCACLHCPCASRQHGQLIMAQHHSPPPFPHPHLPGRQANYTGTPDPGNQLSGSPFQQQQMGSGQAKPTIPQTHDRQSQPLFILWTQPAARGHAWLSRRVTQNLPGGQSDASMLPEVSLLNIHNAHDM